MLIIIHILIMSCIVCDISYAQYNQLCGTAIIMVSSLSLYLSLFPSLFPSLSPFPLPLPLSPSPSLAPTVLNSANSCEQKQEATSHAPNTLILIMPIMILVTETWGY